MIEKKRAAAVLLAMLGLLAPRFAASDERAARVWISTQDGALKLAEGQPIPFAHAAHQAAEVTVDPAVRYQKILGMGSSLEPTTCFNLARLPEDQRAAVIEKMVHPVRGIGMNLMRICIGTPDFTGDPWYSYDDQEPGQTDPELAHFSIEKDKAYILPTLKRAKAANPELLFIASPWSPPGWMKSTGSMIGGKLLPEWRDAYARYFVKFLEAYAADGIDIHAVTVQNEPGVDRSKDVPKWHYPSCRWTGEEERDFIKGFLGPAFVQRGIRTEIWCYDHNFNEIPTEDDDPGLPYPRAILSDPAARRHIAGVAFHGYAGQPGGMSLFHAEFPDTPLYFTEGSVFGTLGGIRLVNYLRNWASGYNGWVTMIDTMGKPNNGPFRATATCIMLDAETLTVQYRFDYYLYGHFMKFVQRGAVRVESGPASTRPANVAFLNPDRTIALVAVNPGSQRSFSIGHAGQVLQTTLPARSIATFVWPAE